MISFIVNIIGIAIVNIREVIYLLTAIITIESACYVFYLTRHSLTNKVYSPLSADFAVISFILYNISGADGAAPQKINHYPGEIRY